MNDPLNRGAQTLTDAMLQIDRNIALAESNVAVAQQVGLPEAAGMAARLPALVLHARQFLASVPDMGQPQRWGEARRLLDQARSYDALFAPYIILGQRVAAAKQAAADHAARTRAAQAAASRARRQAETEPQLREARARFSAARQLLADMQLQRGPGYDDAAWQEAVRSLASILSAQDVRLAGAAASMRDGDFDQAQAALDQTLGELRAGIDMAQRARAAALTRSSPDVAALGVTVPMPHLGPTLSVPSRMSGPLTPPPHSVPVAAAARAISLIEVRTGTVFRCEVGGAYIGRGLDGPRAPDDPDAYLDLSRACDPGEAEYLGVSRRHAELRRTAEGWTIADLSSTNGTRIRRPGSTVWTDLPAHEATLLAEGDILQFGLLEVTVALR
ncbi:MAG: FHA domain-containing protein [Chloroflexota bacterium]